MLLMGFSILHPVADADAWNAALACLPPDRLDIHFTPEYAAAQALLGIEPRLAIYRFDRNYVVLQPFALRAINVGGVHAVDIANLYGYGGPVTNHGPALYQWFDQSFRAWCAEHKVVSEFCALHPLLIGHQASLLRGMPGIGPLDLRKQVVTVDLTGGPMAGYKDRRLAGIKAAERAGVQVAIVANTADFIRLYRQTMARHHAAPRWHVSDEYLDAVARIGHIFHASIDGEVESAAVVLYCGSRAYYHFAGNAMVHPKACANDLLLHTIAMWAKNRGMTMFHLGGGPTNAADDPVLHYKAGFGDGRAPAFSYFRVLDVDAYRGLCALKIADELAATGAQFETSFEPLYRREAS